jgi:hypothetical protein
MPRVEIALTVALDTPLSTAGRAARGSAFPRDLARDSWGRLIVPATHLKGRLRHACLQLARALGLAACTAAAPHAPEARAACPLCALFGAPAQPGALRWRDLPGLDADPDAAPWLHAPAEARAGLALSRPRGVAVAGAHWRPATSALPAGALRFGHPRAIEGTVAALAHVHLLLAGCRLLTHVGQGRSRGLGWARVEAAAQVDGAPLALEPRALAAFASPDSALVEALAP